MTNLEYLLNISTDDKGIGFSIKEALQNAARTGNTPIVQARFAEEATSSVSKIKVTVSDQGVIKQITDVIERSGRVPNNQNRTLYNIESVTLIGPYSENPDFIKTNEESSEQFHNLQQTINDLRAERDLLLERKVPNSALDALLLYFGSIKCSAEIVLDHSTNLEFVKKVFCGELANSFTNYVNQVLNNSLKEEEINKALTYKPKDDKPAIQDYETATKELEFLDQINSGKVSVPESLRTQIIETITAKNHQNTIEEHNKYLKEKLKLEELKSTLKQLKKKYDSFSATIDLLNQASSELPLIIQKIDLEVGLYFPFKVRDTKSGFITDLGTEVRNSFGSVETLNSDFVAFKVPASGVDRLLAEVPITLRLVGYNKLLPYRLV